jgi:polyisoprenoid-binding protein YceI
MIRSPIRTALLGVALSGLFTGAALAGGTCPPGMPPGVFCGGPGAQDLTAGTYKLDDAHASVIAGVSHIGYGVSIFRFGAVSGQLTWDPADLAKAKLNVTVQTASLATPVPNFAAELTGDNFLKSKAFPTATFISTAFHKTDDAHGKVDGQFTLLGKSHPVTFDVELTGAGKGFGHPRAGVHATAEITPADYGMAPMFDRPIKLIIDAEFEKAS